MNPSRVLQQQVDLATHASQEIIPDTMYQTRSSSFDTPNPATLFQDRVSVGRLGRRISQQWGSVNMLLLGEPHKFSSGINRL